MTPQSRAVVLGRAQMGRHICQFYSDPAPLIEAVACYARAALVQGEPVVLIAGSVHAKRLDTVLRRRHANVDRAQQSGQLIVLDAAPMLAQLIQGGTPDWHRFRDSIGSVVERAASNGTGIIRVYGEMVDLLWQRGNTAGAIRLESYWNRLLAVHPMELFCAYRLEPLTWASYESPLNDIGRTHTDILATEDDDRLLAAVDAASEALLGTALSRVLSYSGCEQTRGEHRLPIGVRTLLWLHRNMPNSSTGMLDQIRCYLEAHPKD